MEHLLDLYEKPYDPDYPIICVDERPCQLIENILTPIPCAPGSVRKEGYQYKRRGTCTVFVAVEPLRGFRLLWVRPRRTKKDYARFMQLVERFYPHAKKIGVVEDNLNTHTKGSFYEAFSAPVARALAQRFDVHYTPKKASWLNMAEIELSILSKQCLDRRIPTIELLTNTVAAFERRRNKLNAKITWRFTTADARIKMSAHYRKLL